MGTISEKPTYAHTAFNQVSFKVKKDDTEGKNYVTLNIMKLNYKQPSDISVSLRREYLNGEAWFDISSVLKKWFTDEKIEPKENQYIYYDCDLAQYYAVSLDDKPVDNDFHMALNAAVQCGDKTDMFNDGNRFLTRQKNIKKYEGYPLDVSFIKTDTNAEYYLNLSEVTVGDMLKLAHSSIKIPDGTTKVELSDIPLSTNLTTNKSTNIESNTSNQIVVRNNIKASLVIEKGVLQTCTGLNPFYVRWINQLGGFEYWMFYHNQKLKLNAKTTDTIEPVIHSISNTSYIIRELNKEVESFLTVGAGNLKPDEHLALSEIPTSPRVEYWNEKIGKWIRIYCENSKIESNTRDMTKDIEIEFTLPIPQIQF